MTDWPILKNELENYRKQVEVLELPDKNKIDRIYISGFGGSGIVGRLFEKISYVELSNEIRFLSITSLPKFISNKDFFILISYSGNTYEILKLHSELKSKGISHICITSGGILKSLCRNVILVPKGMLPREAFPYLFLAVSSVIENMFKYPIYPSLSRFEELRPIAESVDIRIQKEPVIIYSWYLYYPAALRFKQDLNENTKLQAYSLELPEACHNEIEGTKSGTFVVFRGSREENDIVDTFIEVLPRKPIEIKVRDSRYIAEMLLMFYISDIISIKEAERRKVDWRSTPKINIYKEKLLEKGGY